MQDRIDPLGSEEVRCALAFARARERYAGARRDDLLSCCEAAWETAVPAGSTGDPIDRFQSTLNLIAWTRGWTRGPLDLRDLEGQSIPLAVLRPFMLAGGELDQRAGGADPDAAAHGNGAVAVEGAQTGSAPARTAIRVVGAPAPKPPAPSKPPVSGKRGVTPPVGAPAPKPPVAPKSGR